MKHSDLHYAIGIWLIVDALLSILYSTDLILLFQIGRMARLVIGLFILAGRLPQKYWKWIGLYLALEALGSTIISPDDGLLWQAGRIGRVLIGAWMWQDEHGGKS